MNYEQLKKISRVVLIVELALLLVCGWYRHTALYLKPFVSAEMYKEAKIADAACFVFSIVSLYGVELFTTIGKFTKKKFVWFTALCVVLIVTGSLYILL